MGNSGCKLPQTGQFFLLNELRLCSFQFCICFFNFFCLCQLFFTSPLPFFAQHSFFLNPVYPYNATYKQQYKGNIGREGLPPGRRNGYLQRGDIARKGTKLASRLHFERIIAGGQVCEKYTLLNTHLVPLIVVAKKPIPVTCKNRVFVVQTDIRDGNIIGIMVKLILSPSIVERIEQIGSGPKLGYFYRLNKIILLHVIGIKARKSPIS